MGDAGIALLCTLHPASHEKQSRVLSLLRAGARDYYTVPASHCTTWSYFTQYPPSNASTLKKPLICGLEIYARKSALQQQIDNKPFFQAFHEKVQNEELYCAEEELQAWYLTEGFVVRQGQGNGKKGGGGGGGGYLVSLTRLTGEREGVLSVLREFVPFVREKEADVLTYAIFTRPKAPREVLIFVRYRDRKAFRRHADADEHTSAVRKLAKIVENDLSNATTIWQEVEDSFVSTTVGGVSGETKL